MEFNEATEKLLTDDPPGYFPPGMDVLYRNALSVYSKAEIDAKLDLKVDQAEYDAALITLNNSINLKAPINSPVFTGTPSAPTPATSDESPALATTAYVVNRLNLTYTAADILAKLLTVDTDDSGLNANFLQGFEADHFAPINSPQLQGNPTAPNQAVADISLKIANTQFVYDRIQNILSSTYTAADVLAKLLTVDTDTSGLNANTLQGNNAAYFASAASVSSKANTNSPVFTGDPQAPTPSTGDNDTSIATTAYVMNTLGASPALGGNPTAPTASPGDNGTSIATTAFVTAAISAFRTSLLSTTNAWSGINTFGAETVFNGQATFRAGTTAMVFNPTAGSLSYILQNDNDNRLHILGGSSPGVSNGSAIVLDGINYGGSGLGGNLALYAANAGKIDAYVNSVAQFSVSSVGTRFNNGINFGSVTPGGPGFEWDVSKHIALYSDSYGIGITAPNSMNVVVPSSAGINFVVGAAPSFRFQGENVPVFYMLPSGGNYGAICLGGGVTNGSLRLGGGTGTATANGAIIHMYGVDHATLPGLMNICAGSAAGDIQLQAGGSVRMVVNNAGNIVFGAGYNSGGSTDGRDFLNGQGIMRSSRSATSNQDHQQFANPNGQVGNIRTTGTNTQFNTTSDETLKTFIGEYDVQSAIAIIRADPVMDFHWNADGSYAVGWGAQTSYAVSQDLASTGGWVDNDTGGYIEEDNGNATYSPWGIDLGKRTPYLWAATSWLLDENDALKAKVATLETQITDILSRLSALEAA